MIGFDGGQVRAGCPCQAYEPLYRLNGRGGAPRGVRARRAWSAMARAIPMSGSFRCLDHSDERSDAESCSHILEEGSFAMRRLVLVLAVALAIAPLGGCKSGGIGSGTNYFPLTADSTWTYQILSKSQGLQ